MERITVEKTETKTTVEFIGIPDEKINSILQQFPPQIIWEKD